MTATAMLMAFGLAVLLIGGLVVLKARHGQPCPLNVPAPDLWEIPDQTGHSTSFSQFLGSLNTNGRYDRFTKEWVDQHQPRHDDLVMVLTMDSAQGINVNRDERGRVIRVAWEDGWNQDAILVKMESGEERKFPVSDTLPTPGNTRVWVAFV